METNSEKHTKVCTMCKTEKPIEDFYLRKNGVSYSACKECVLKYNRNKRRKTSTTEPSPLSGFTARELINELRLRGYKGELRFENVIKL